MAEPSNRESQADHNCPECGNPPPHTRIDASENHPELIQCACGATWWAVAPRDPVAEQRVTGRAQIADRIKRRQRVPGVWLPAFLIDPFRHCRHDCQRAIYGDEIIAAGFRRSRCLDCGRLLPNLPQKGQVCRHGDVLR